MKDINNQMFMPYDNNGMYMPYDLENRLNSLERMVRRLDARITKLENSSMNALPDIYNQNIYPNAMNMM